MRHGSYTPGWPKTMTVHPQTGMVGNSKQVKVVPLSDAKRLREERDEARAAINQAVACESDTQMFNLLRHFQVSLERAE